MAWFTIEKNISFFWNDNSGHRDMEKMIHLRYSWFIISILPLCFFPDIVDWFEDLWIINHLPSGKRLHHGEMTFLNGTSHYGFSRVNIGLMNANTIQSSNVATENNHVHRWFSKALTRFGLFIGGNWKSSRNGGFNRKITYQ